MIEINAKWLKSRLGTDRGLKAELSRVTGITPDKISKILAGTRQIKASEAPLIYSFFSQDRQVEALTQEERDVLLALSRLSPSARRLLLETAKGLADLDE